MIGKQEKLLNTVTNLKKVFKKKLCTERNSPVKKDGFILEHGLYPKIYRDILRSIWTRMSYIYYTPTENIEIAQFCRHVRDVKSDCKNQFGIRETTT